MATCYKVFNSLNTAGDITENRRFVDRDNALAYVSGLFDKLRRWEPFEAYDCSVCTAGFMNGGYEHDKLSIENARKRFLDEVKEFNPEGASTVTLWAYNREDAEQYCLITVNYCAYKDEE